MTLFSPGDCGTVLPSSVMKIPFPVRKWKLTQRCTPIQPYNCVLVDDISNFFQRMSTLTGLRTLRWMYSTGKIIVSLIYFLSSEDNLHHSTSLLIIQYNILGLPDLRGYFLLCSLLETSTSYNKTNWMHWFLTFIFGIKLYMFRTVPLSIIRSVFTVRTAMVYVIQLASRIRTELRPDPARKLSANLYDIYHCCVYSEKLLMMDRGTVRNM